MRYIQSYILKSVASLVWKQKKRGKNKVNIEVFAPILAAN